MLRITVSRFVRVRERTPIKPVLLALAVALAGCGPELSPTDVIEALTPKAGPLCDNAFASPPPGNAAPGSVAGPAIALIQYDFSQIDEKHRHGNPPLTAFRAHYGEGVPARAKAKSTEAVQTVACIRERQVLLGFYQPGDMPGLRDDWDVRLLRWPGGEQIAGITFMGLDPPAETELRAGTKTGGPPTEPASAWFDEVIAR